MTSLLKRLEEAVSGWPNISAHAHRFGGTEFRSGSEEVGHAHPAAIVDIPFPRPVRDALLEEGLAQEHQWVPNSGWTTFYARSEQDLKHVLWLMRLSYLRYALKTAADPHELLERESADLRLTARFKSLMAKLVAARAERGSESAGRRPESVADQVARRAKRTL